MTAYNAAQAALRAQVSLDDPEAAPHREAALALAASRMVDLGLSLPPSSLYSVAAPVQATDSSVPDSAVTLVMTGPVAAAK